MADAASNDEDVTALIERNVSSNFPDLRDQEKAFAYELIANGYDHRLAAESVGYSKGYGVRILRRPLVSAFVSKLQQDSHVSDIITKDFITTQYLNLLDIGMGNQEIPIVTGAGIEMMAKKFMPELVTKCVDKLSSLAPEYKDVNNSSGGVNIQLNFEAVRGGDAPEGVTING